MKHGNILHFSFDSKHVHLLPILAFFYYFYLCFVDGKKSLWTFKAGAYLYILIILALFLDFKFFFCHAEHKDLRRYPTLLNKTYMVWNIWGGKLKILNIYYKRRICFAIVKIHASIQKWIHFPNLDEKIWLCNEILK